MASTTKILPLLVMFSILQSVMCFLAGAAGGQKLVAFDVMVYIFYAIVLLLGIRYMRVFSDNGKSGMDVPPSFCVLMLLCTVQLILACIDHGTQDDKNVAVIGEMVFGIVTVAIVGLVYGSGYSDIEKKLFAK